MLFHGVAAALALALGQGASAACQGGENPAVPASTPSERFVDQGNGLVLHLPTRLIWQRCPLGQSWTGTACSGEADLLDWSAALQTADAHEQAGFDDWRLPDRKELASIVETRCHSPAVNGAIFPDHPISAFWTASPASDAADAAWSIDFVEGAIQFESDSQLRAVRLVRGGRR
jgi:hypothetical protein